jgi:hypothetical protein
MTAACMCLHPSIYDKQDLQHHIILVSGVQSAKRGLTSRLIIVSDLSSKPGLVQYLASYRKYNYLLKPVRALRRNITRLPAIKTSALAESALIEIVSGYTQYGNSSIRITHAQYELPTEIVRRSTYVCICILCELIRVDENGRLCLRDDDPSY